jgi:hypothetical protein
MDNSDPDKTKKSDVNLPPIKLPPPDPFDTRNSNEGKNTLGKNTKAKDKKKSRHPTDRYEDVRREKKGGGCCASLGCLALLLILLVVGGVGYAGYVMAGDLKGYAVVQLRGREETVSESPTEPTIYIGQGRVIYNVPQTSAPVAIFAPEIEVSGEFQESLHLRGGKVTCQAGAICQKNLDVYAVEFVDEGIEVKGEKKGKTIK